jgi:hypothetical protein
VDLSPCRPLRDVEAVARRVRLLLGYASPVAADAPRPTSAAVEQIATVTPLRREKPAAADADDSAGRRVGAAQS